MHIFWGVKIMPDEGVTNRRPRDCRFFNSCDANLCPLDPMLKEMPWLPEETGQGEICRNPEFAKLQFVITQKKIRKALRKRTEERDDYFTLDMLNRDIIVKSGIWGIQDPPDTIRNTTKWYEDKKRKWIHKHPVRKKLSMEEVQRRIVHMKTVREGIKK